MGFTVRRLVHSSNVSSPLDIISRPRRSRCPWRHRASVSFIYHGCIEELEVERKRHRAIKEKLALTDAESASIREEAESAKYAWNLAIKNFRESQEYKNKIFESGFISYCIGYEDGKDVVGKLYPNVDLSSIVPPSSGEEAVEKIIMPNERDAPATSKSVSITEAVLE